MSVHKDGTKYRVRYRDAEGRNRNKTFTKWRDADKFDREMKDARDQGQLLNPDRGDMSFAKFFEEVYLPTRQVSESTKDNQRRLYGRKDPADDEVRHLRKKWGAMKMRDVNRSEAVLRWHTEMRKAGVSDAGMFQSHALLVMVIGHAVQMEYLPRLKIGGLQPEYDPTPNEDPWLPEQIEDLRNELLRLAVNPPQGHGGARRATHEWMRRRDAVAVSIMGYAALRIGECFALQWPMLLKDNRIARTVQVDSRVPINEADAERRTKTTRRRGVPRSMRKPRLIPLQPDLRSDLMEWWLLNGRPTTGYVLPQEKGGDRFDARGLNNWRHRFGVYAKQAGVGDRSPKHLRVSCVSMWIRAGRDPGTVAGMAGHSVAVMWGTYHQAFRELEEHPDQRFDIDSAVRAARDRGTGMFHGRSTGTEG